MDDEDLRHINLTLEMMSQILVDVEGRTVILSDMSKPIRKETFPTVEEAEIKANAAKEYAKDFYRDQVTELHFNNKQNKPLSD